MCKSSRQSRFKRGANLTEPLTHRLFLPLKRTSQIMLSNKIFSTSFQADKFQKVGAKDIDDEMPPGFHLKVDSKWKSLKKFALALFLFLLFLSLGASIAILRSYTILIQLHDHPDLVKDVPHWPTVETSRGDEAFWCDRSDNRTDVCFMRGDVLLVPGHSTSLVLYSKNDMFWHRDEMIWPYARKWDDSTLRNVEPVVLRNKLEESNLASGQRTSVVCEVIHRSPLLLFSTGGYTGNPYHDFNDVLIPLFINSRHYRGEVVFGITDVRDWWIERFSAIFKLLSRHRIVNVKSIVQTHCFPEATVGLRVHADLAIDPFRMVNNETTKDFQKLLHQAFAPQGHLPKISSTGTAPYANEKTLTDCNMAIAKNSNTTDGCRLKLVIISRKGSRMILNLNEVVGLATKNGFDVEVLEPSVHVGMQTIYRSLHSADVMIGVHGAALTHILFMRPRSVFIQIVPLGTDWPARTYYQEPAENELDLQYIEYRITPNESTLTRTYGMDDVVIKDPEALAAHNWDIRKKMYLEGQNVQLSIPRIRATLGEATRLATKALSSTKY